MSGKDHLSECHDWTNNQTMKASVHHKMVLPHLPNEEVMEHKLVDSIKKKDGKVFRYMQGIETQRAKRQQEKESRSAKENDASMINEEKGQVIDEIKEWIKIVENAKYQGKLQNSHLSKLLSELYKWGFFIQQMLNCYLKLESSPSTHIKGSCLNSPRSPDKVSHKVIETCEKQQKSHRDIEEKQIQRLSLKIKELQEQADGSRVNNFKSIQRISELETLFSGCMDKIKYEAQIYKDSCEAICCILIENQSFLKDLQEAITIGKQTATFKERIDFQLSNLREYKTKYCLKHQ